MARLVTPRKNCRQLTDADSPRDRREPEIRARACSRRRGPRATATRSSAAPLLESDGHIRDGRACFDCASRSPPDRLSRRPLWTTSMRPRTNLSRCCNPWEQDPADVNLADQSCALHREVSALVRLAERRLPPGPAAADWRSADRRPGGEASPRSLPDAEVAGGSLQRQPARPSGSLNDRRRRWRAEDLPPPRCDRSLRLASAYPPRVASQRSRHWLERPPPTDSLLEQIVDGRAFIGVHRPEEVLRVVYAAYRTVAAGRDWDPSAGTTTLEAATVEACARSAAPLAGGRL